MMIFRRTLLAMARPLYLDASRPILVLAPHPDDETLGCGGTIAALIERRADVYVTFATDGSGSSRDGITPVELARIRMSEARAACRTLGIADAACTFLGFRDGHLSTNTAAVAAAIERQVRSLDAGTVLVCSRYDSHPDHRALHAAAQVAAVRHDARLIEYPIWFWSYRALAGSGNRFPAGASKVGKTQRQVLREHRIFKMDVGRNLELKRSALAHHRSQMGKLPGHTNWPKLDDTFLRPLCSRWEVFLVSKEPSD